MLSFDSSLTNRLNTANTECFFALKLYYNDETSFIGVSDQYIIDGSDEYHGIVKSWGSLSQGINFFGFTVSDQKMSVTLMNTNDAIQNGRFSDLWSTYNFDNRKWELFLCAKGLDTLDTSARMIGTGIISGNIKYNLESTNVQLIGNFSKNSFKIPAKIVDSTYDNPPENNINKPIPMAYGDFHDKTGIGTIPSSGANFDRHFTKAKFPAIVVDAFSATNARTEALVDYQAVHTLDTENVYMGTEGLFGACSSSNVSIDTSASATVTAKGTDWRFYINPMAHGTYDGGTNYSNMFDNEFGTSPYNLVNTGDSAASVGFRIGKLPNLGVLTAVKALCAFGSFTGAAPNVNFRLSGGAGAGGDVKDTLTWNGGDQEGTITGLYATGEQSSWDTETEFYLTIDNTGGIGNRNVDIDEIGVEFQVEPSQTFTVRVGHIEEVITSSTVSPYYDKSENAGEAFEVSHKIITTETKKTPASVDYLYCSGKGRKFGSWITDSSRSVGYSSGDLIENPIFILEDMLRTELTLGDTNINVTSFNESGNTTNGYIGDIFNDAVTDIQSSFSQHKFIDLKNFGDKICRQSLSWFFCDGAGKYTIKTLRRPTDYSASDKVIDFADMTFKSINKTSLNNVKNDITVNYNYHYIKEESTESVNVTDATSKGDTVDGYNFSDGLKLDIECNTIIDDTTANKLANAYLAIFKDRKVILSFDLPTAYLDLEICDIVSFKDWDSNIKIYGDEMATDDYYMITKISKKPTGCSVEAIKVSE